MDHDRRAALLSVFPDCTGPGSFAQGVHDIAAGRCLFLDTAEPGTHAGHYCESRQDWLEARLREHPGPFLLFMHPIDSVAFGSPRFAARRRRSATVTAR